MRVILKPVGLITILIAFGAMAGIVAYQSRAIKAKETAPIASAPTSAGTPAAPTPAASPVPPSLQNTDFESEYLPTVPYDTKASLSGSIAGSWSDDSSWAPVTVAYDKDTNDPHGGKLSQRVNVSAVASDKGEARVQFIQPVALEKNKRYRATCWLRADRPTEIDLALRQKAWPYRYYGINKIKLGTTWQKAEVTGTPIDGDATLFMLKVSKPVTFWVDDASLTPAE